MIVIKTCKENSSIGGTTIAVDVEYCKKHLRYYFADIIKVKGKILAGEIINTPYIIFQKDRRVNQEKRIPNERRRRLLEAF